MQPSSESTALEGAQGPQEYIAAGKLKGNKALITGGECVSISHSAPHVFGDLLTNKPLKALELVVP